MPSRLYTTASSTLALPALLFALSYSVQTLAAANETGPAFIGVGPVAITPTLGTEIKYSDNIYLQEKDTTSSWIYLARPEVNFRVQDRDNLYQLDYKGEAGWYQEDSTNDRNDYFDSTFSGDFFIALMERWTITGYAGYALLHEDRGTGLTEGEIGEAISKPVRYDQTDVNGTVEYASGIGRLELSAGYMDRAYQNFKEFTRSRDVEETAFGVKFFYPIAPMTDIFLDYNYGDFSYPNPFIELPPLDSKEHTLQAGIEWEITPNTTSSVQMGYTEKNFDSPEREDWDGITWMLSLQMQPTELDTVSITGTKAPEETSLQGDFINRESITVSWTHDWSDRVNTDLSGTVSRERYEGSIDDRDDYVYNITPRINYEFRRWCIVYASYAWNEKDSNADTLSYTENAFMVGVDFSL